MGKDCSLATVSRSKRITNTDAYRSLLFSLCVLEYVDEEGQIWHDIHPVIEQITEFREAFAKIENDLSTD